MNFRKPQTIKRKSDGEWVNGRWVESGEVEATILASVQPLRKGDYDMLENQMSGMKLKGAVRIYTNDVLNVAGDDLTGGDVLVWLGKNYRIVGVSEWQSGVISHYRYYGVMIDG